MTIFKKIRRFLLVAILLLVTFPLKIEAAGAAFYVNGGTTVYRGDSVNVVVVGGTNKPAMYQYSIKSSHSGVVSGTSYVSSKAEGNTMSFNLRANSVGSTTLSLSVTEAVDDDLDDVSMPGNSITINVVERPKEKPQPAPTVDDPSRPKPEQKPQQESAADREAREQREKEAEEARKKKEEEQKKEELEAAKLVPLVTSINVISDSDKLNGEVLTEIKTEKDKFDYEYTLPRRVDAFKLDLKSDATLDYIKDHKFSDNENEKKIVVKAKNDDFDQTINIVVKRNTDPLLERAVGDKKLKVYDDELLNKLMEEKGFELKNFKEGEVEHTFFTKGKVNVQLLVDDKGAAQWYLLDGSNKAVEPVAFFLGKEGDVLFIKSPSEELQKETLHGNKYEVKSRALPKEFTEMDKELKIENKYGAWEFEDGEIVFAMDENLEEGLFHINSKELVKSAVVAFDQVDAKMKTIAIGTSVALLGLIAANIVYIVVNKKNENELI